MRTNALLPRRPRFVTSLSPVCIMLACWLRRDAMVSSSYAPDGRPGGCGSSVDMGTSLGVGLCSVTSDAPSMASDTRHSSETVPEVQDLLPLALSEPQRAKTAAESILATSRRPHDLSVAYQVVAIVERDAGHLAPAVAAARSALRHARRVDNSRAADVLATLGATLVYAGRTADGDRYLREAETLTTPDRLPHLLLRRAVIGCHTLGDDLWEARGLTTRSVIWLAMGDPMSADSDARRAEEIFARVDQQLESAYAMHNRAIAAHLQGDLAGAL